MKVKRFFAPDMSTAMRTVREEVGPDAVILSNNSVAGGVEVVVALEYVDGPQVPIKSVSRPASAASPSRLGSPEQVKALVGMKKPVRTAEDLEKTRRRIASQNAQRSAEVLMKPRRKDNQLNLDDAVWDDVLAALGKDERVSEPKLSKSRLPESRSPEPQGFSAPASVVVSDETAPSFSRAATPVSKIRQRLAMEEQQVGRSEANDQALQAMRDEIDELKAMLRSRLRPAAEDVAAAPKSVEENPVVERLSRQFERMNLQADLSAKLLQGFEADREVGKAWKVALRRLSDALPTVGENIAERGGILAFVGATGVGKTTTIGKLATQYVLKHGSAGIALVTTDSYRIAAHEQLKTFGRILDVPVRVVDENHSLDETLHTLRDKRLILVDTSGLSSSATHRQEQLTMLSDSSYRIKKFMVMPCTAQFAALQSSYQQFKGMGLNGVVLTKADEAVSLGEVISLVVEQRLPVAYLADGQKIPDDLEVARANALVSRAVVLSEQQAKQQSAALSADMDSEQDDVSVYLERQQVG